MNANLGDSALSRARTLLATLAREGSQGGLPAAEALAILDDVHPPRPPVKLLTTGDRATMDDAVGALRAAAAVAADPAEAATIVAASQALVTPLPG